jgi:hypothetical protein
MGSANKRGRNVRGTFWLLIVLWMVGGLAIMLPWALEALSDGAVIALLLSWMLTLSVLNYWLVRCPRCHTSLYYVRWHVYAGWPKWHCRKCGYNIT